VVVVRVNRLEVETQVTYVLVALMVQMLPMDPVQVKDYSIFNQNEKSLLSFSQLHPAQRLIATLLVVVVLVLQLRVEQQSINVLVVLMVPT